MASVGTKPVKRAERDGVKARNCALKDPSLGMQAEIWRPPEQWRSSNSTWEGAAPTTSVVKVRISGLMRFLSSLSPSRLQKYVTARSWL